MNSLTALLLPPMLLVPLMGILSRLRGSTALTRELRRKALHVGVGLTALAFPLLFDDAWTVIAALGLIIAWMVAVRTIEPLKRRFGACLHETERESHGELYFAVALAILLLIGGHTADGSPLHYAIPVLILTLADTAAAVIGRAFPIGTLGRFGGGKTQSGCAAFFIVAYFITAILLTAGTSLSPLATIGIATAVAATTCGAEALSHRGIDNLSVPLVAYFVLTSLGV